MLQSEELRTKRMNKPRQNKWAGRHECSFPGCHTEIRHDATMCTNHWRYYHAAAQQLTKKHKNVPQSEIIKAAIEKEKAFKQKITQRKQAWEEGTIYVHAGKV